MPSADLQDPGIHVADTLNCAKLVHYVRAIYPQEAKRARIQGVVKLRATITKTGEVKNVEAISGDPMLIPAALDAAWQWRYTPCIVESQPVEIVTAIDISFTLRQ